MRCSAFNRGAGPAALRSIIRSGPSALNRSTQSRIICRPTPPTRAALLRLLGEHPAVRLVNHISLASGKSFGSARRGRSYEVVRTAFQDAASVAGLLVTIAAMVAESRRRRLPPCRVVVAWATWTFERSPVLGRRRGTPHSGLQSAECRRQLAPATRAGDDIDTQPTGLDLGKKFMT